MVFLEIREEPDHLADQEIVAMLVHQDPWDHQEHQVSQELTAKEVNQEDQHQVHLYFQAIRVNRVNQDPQAYLGQMEIQAVMDNQEVPDQMDHQDHRDHLEILVLMVKLVHPVNQVHRVNEVFVRNIVHWTEVYSSKMEHEDNPFFHFSLYSVNSIKIHFLGAH